jgi:DUF1365 family protein
VITQAGAIPAGLLHTGVVSHRRHVAPLYRFRYRIWMLSLDLDRLEALGLRLFRHNRSGVTSLQARDHGPRDGSALRPWVERQLARAGLSAFAESIRLMVIPRVLGYAFNPISLYFCYDAAGRLGAVLHQVKNTFGDQQPYCLPVAPELGLIRQASPKRMHVSPFFDMQGGYRFALTPPDLTPGGVFALSIRYGLPEAPRLTASMRLVAGELTDRTLLGQLLVMPMMPMKVIAAIHWEAMKIWLRGARYHKVPTHTQEPA